MPAPILQASIATLFYRTLAECFNEARPANGQPCEVIYQGIFTLADRGVVLEMTSAMIDEMVWNFDGPDRLCVNINHNSAGDTLETARAVGWIQRIYKQEGEDGRVSLMAEIRWTEDMLLAIAADHYKYLSAEILFHAVSATTGEEVGTKLLGCAATNIPAIPNLSPLCLIYTALNSPSKVALSTQSVMALHPGNSLEPSREGGLPGSLMERVECVIRCFYGFYPDTNETMWRVRDVATDQCLVSRCNQGEEKTWQVGYQMAADGTCTFAPMPQWVEVRQVYVPVTVAASQVKPSPKPVGKTGNSANLSWILNPSQAAGNPPAASTHKEPQMDETQIRSLLGLAADADLATVLPALAAKAARIEALEAQVADLEQVKARAAATQEKLAVTEGQVLTLTQQKTAFEQETTTLATRLQALETERNERNAKDRLDLALKNRKVKPAELEAEGGFLKTLAQEQPGTFDKIMSARPAYAVDLTVEVGSDAEGVQEEQAADQLFRLTNEALDQDPRLKPQDARARVLSQHPDLKTAIPTTRTGTR